MLWPIFLQRIKDPQASSLVPEAPPKRDDPTAPNILSTSAGPPDTRFPRGQCWFHCTSTEPCMAPRGSFPRLERGSGASSQQPSAFLSSALFFASSCSFCSPSSGVHSFGHAVCQLIQWEGKATSCHSQPQSVPEGWSLVARGRKLNDCHYTCTYDR